MANKTQSLSAGSSNPSLKEKLKIPCSECNKTFSSKQCLKEHMYKHSNIKPYGCFICKKRFRHASQYTVHRKNHRDAQDFFFPVLAEMEKESILLSEALYKEYPKIQIPLISGPQPFSLPLFDQLNS